MQCLPDFKAETAFHRCRDLVCLGVCLTRRLGARDMIGLQAPPRIDGPVDAWQAAITPPSDPANARAGSVGVVSAD